MTFSVSCKQNNSFTEKDDYVDVKENRIHVKTVGTGKPVVLIHGGFLDLRMWEEQVRPLIESGYQVIRYSDVAHGATVNSGNTVFGYEVLHAVINHFGVDKAILVGHSGGAVHAVDFTLNYPDKVEKLILVSPGLNQWRFFNDTAAHAISTKGWEANQNGDTMLAAICFHRNWVLGPRRSNTDVQKDFFHSTRKMIFANMRTHWNKPWSAVDTLQARERLHQINQSTLLIVGDEDVYDIREIANVYNSNLLHSKMEVLQNAAHLIPWEYPKVFNTLLLGFIE